MIVKCNDNDEIQGSFAALRMTTVLGVLRTTTVLGALGTADGFESLRSTTGCGMLFITRVMRSRRSGVGAV
jgi:hypothetical protein